MRTLLGAVLVLGSFGVAFAAPHSVLVMPLDGNVDASARGKLNAEVVRLARKLPGTVSVADTTFEETAAAVGCDATQPACGETVRSTLGVDEIIYGRATTDGSKTNVIVYRVRDHAEPHYARAVGDHSAEPELWLQPVGELFQTDASPHTERPVNQTPPAVPPTVPAERGQPKPLFVDTVDHPGRTRGIILTAAGAALLVGGGAMWLSTRGDQSDIDDATPSTAADFRTLKDKEDRVNRNAIVGDVLVGVGAGLATWGVITLVKSRHASENVVLAPRVSSSTAGLVLEGAW